ncbi:MAG: hypothetical protein KF708_20590 [Pirellulales bacterium]|nr:hypothetical protein [Pirellulales bacterium]
MKPESPWKFDDRMAHLEWGTMRVQVDFRSPQHGVQVVASDPSRGVLHLLGVELGEENPPLADVFVRGGDLVATYEQTEQRPARVQIYWRQIGPLDEERLTFDLIVSVQTSLLDSWPSLMTHSSVPSRQVRRLASLAEPRFDRLASETPVALLREGEADTACLEFALPASPATYVEMIHPSDFWRGSVTPSDGGPLGVQCGWELFPQHLEKGVILRARLRGILYRAAPDEAAIVEQHDEFLSEKLPLTV